MTVVGTMWLPPLQGFNPALVGSKYGSKLHVWDWDTKKLRQTLDMGPEGLIPLEIRFKHHPDEANGFVGAALSSNVHHIHRVRSGTSSQQYLTE